MRGMGPPQNMMGSSPGPTGGVAQVSVNLPFHNPTPYHAFLGAKQHQKSSIVRFTKSMGMGRDNATLFRSIQKYQILYTVIFVHLEHILLISGEHWMHLQTGWIERNSG
jgi:hypothetical protein